MSVLASDHAKSSAVLPYLFSTSVSAPLSNCKAENYARFDNFTPDGEYQELDDLDVVPLHRLDERGVPDYVLRVDELLRRHLHQLERGLLLPVEAGQGQGGVPLPVHHESGALAVQALVLLEQELEDVLAAWERS